VADSKLTRYRNKVTGSIVRVDDETAKTLGAAEFEKITDAQAKKLRSGESEQPSR
jgi:hypothetical protein